jgi:hypothetical protein
MPGKLLRLFAFMQTGSRQQQAFHPGGEGACDNVIAIFGKLRAGEVKANIKHAVSHKNRPDGRLVLFFSGLV